MTTRILRYLSVYVVLLAILAVVRVSTQHTFPALQGFIDQEEALVYREAQLGRELESLESKARVRDWATRNAMIPWTIARHTFVKMNSVNQSVPILKVSPKIEVQTLWR